VPASIALRFAAAALLLAACRPTKESAPPIAEPLAAAPQQPQAAPDPTSTASEPESSAPAPEPEPTAPEPALAETPTTRDATAEATASALGCASERRFIYGIGSSSMGSLLGPMLGRQIREHYHGATFRKWGKAASGLARPDFHDWIAEVPSINADYDPDVYVVSIGTNDAQPLYSRRFKWIRKTDPRWRELYAERIDALLDLMAGEDRRRRIIWIGPNAFPKKNSRQLGPVIDELLAERIAAFDGDAHYIALYDATSPKPGEFIETVDVPGYKAPMRAWSDDGIHLSRFAVRALMIEPALALLDACLLDGEGDLAADE
jgi:hypothetical protein